MGGSLVPTTLYLELRIGRYLGHEWGVCHWLLKSGVRCGEAYAEVQRLLVELGTGGETRSED